MKEAKECGPPEEASSAQKVYDIDDVMDEKSKTVTDHEQYVMFKNHLRPGEKCEFKKPLKHGCYKSCKKKKKNFMAPFYGWGSTASRLEPLRGGSLLFTTKFPEVPGTHFIDLGRMKG